MAESIEVDPVGKSHRTEMKNDIEEGVVMSETKFPADSYAARVQRLIEQYESMSEEVEGAKGESATPRTA
jgi:hypothetical protein